MYGTRGRIGLIALATDNAVLPDFARLMPDGVAVYQTLIGLPRGEASAAALTEMLADDRLERAAELLSWLNVDVIVFACTTGSLLHGPGWDRTLVERIERASGRKATTTTTAVLDGLRALDATTLAIATPYVEELNEAERVFLEASGYRVANITGLGCPTDADIGRLGPGDAVALAERVDTPEANALFISCTNFDCLLAVATLERRLGKPVITSNLAGGWAAIRRIGVDDAIPGYGRLLTLPFPVPIPMEVRAT
jgi:maleate isomerase